MPRALEDESHTISAGPSFKSVRMSPYSHATATPSARSKRSAPTDRPEPTEVTALRDAESLHAKDAAIRSRAGARIYHPRATVVLIGMRGVGKTTLGLIAATAMGRRFVDTDTAIETSLGTSIGTFIRSFPSASLGWAAFRERETQIVRTTLAKHPFDTVIATGGGVIESGDSREALRSFRHVCPVILVLREREAVRQYLIGQTSRPDYQESIVNVMQRREPLLWSCASHAFVSLTSEKCAREGASHPLALKAVEQDLLRLLRFIFSHPSALGESLYRSPAGSRQVSPAVTPGAEASVLPQLTLLDSYDAPDRKDQATTFLHPPGPSDPTNRAHLLTRRTAFLSLTLPDLSKVSQQAFDEMVQGVDAVELRADTWHALANASRSNRAALSREEPPQIDFVEVAIQIAHARRLSRGLPLLFTLRYHDMRGDLRWDSATAMQLYDRARSFDGVDIVEMIGYGTPTQPEQNLHLLTFQARVLARAASDPGRKLPPLLAININETGRSTRVLNMVLSPVSHAAQPHKAAVGQMSYADVSRAQHLLGVSSATRCYEITTTEPSSNISTSGRSRHSFSSRLQRALQALGEANEVSALSVRDLQAQLQEAEMRLPALVQDAAVLGINLASGAWLAQEAILGRLEACGAPRTLSAAVVGAADVLYRTDASSSLMGTTAGALTPQGFMAIAAPLGADHSLPGAIERVMQRLLSPINTPSPANSALVICLPLRSDATAEVKAGNRVALRSAVLAMARLGFGSCAVVEDWTQHPRSPDLDGWTSKVAVYAQAEAAATHKAAMAHTPGGLGSLEGGHNSHARKCAIVRLSSEALSDVVGGIKAAIVPSERRSSHAADHGLLSPHGRARDKNERSFANHVRHPHAVVLVGGTERAQRCAISLLTGRPDAHPDDIVLPAALWESNLGGTLIRFPTEELQDVQSSVEAQPDEFESEASPEQNGWLLVPPHVIELDRFNHGIFPALTRRRAPRNIS
ncbi:pentafunctional protein [Ceraceosorus bombacis]|uniref:shikimate kinase n=1 Tax=Ceraceosorus bombacis TaxID=401625 RepID=A0A0P1BM08_9BASI|nr:pentafunctional protein [Ceraceosorus bombacis]